MADALAGQWVGPMPIQEFIETFLRLDEAILASMPDFESKSKHFDCLAKEDMDTAMYDPFITAVESSGVLQDKYKVVNTSGNRDASDVSSMKNTPDVSCYASGIGLGVNSDPTNFELKSHRRPADPFDDKGKAGTARHFEPISGEDGVPCPREMCRAQLACHAGIWSAQQHRTHCFLIWLGDPHARLIRMDRSGGIVSAKFNYRQRGHHLLEFLWRFAQSTPSARGRDDTVSKASPEEAAKAVAILKGAKFIPSATRSVFRIQVPDARASFLVWGPLAEPHSPTGRATRIYPAVDPSEDNGNGCIVLLKDSWRSSEEGMEQEAAIIRELNEEGCRNVPTLVCGDDLHQQFTLTKDYAKQAWNIGGRSEDFVARVHTRHVQKEVGYHLDRFQSSRDLFQAVYDAVLAHKDAYEQCGILHRDISGGNVLMRQNGWGGGFLNDWDLAKHVHWDPVPQKPSRFGTWQFMSAALLESPYKTNALQDDLESFFWVILYYVLRYSRHSRVDHVKADMRRVFDAIYGHPLTGQLAEGGAGKRLLFSTRKPLQANFAVVDNMPATQFIRNMLKSWYEWYSQLDQYNVLIVDEQETHRISEEEALARLPFDDRNLAMKHHECLTLCLEAALDHIKWPINDEAKDNFEGE